MKYASKIASKWCKSKADTGVGLSTTLFLLLYNIIVPLDNMRSLKKIINTTTFTDLIKNQVQAINISQTRQPGVKRW
jgi:hypothetical protein